MKETAMTDAHAHSNQDPDHHTSQNSSQNGTQDTTQDATQDTTQDATWAERRSVLELLVTNSIDIDEALELLAALDDTPTVSNTPVMRKARAVHITVERPDAKNINVTIPASLTKIALKLMPKDMREQLTSQGIDPDTVKQLLAGELPIGRLLDLSKNENGVSTHVTIDVS